MFRPLTSRERAILDKLFECDFPGHSELHSQLDRVSAEEIDEAGGLHLRVDGLDEPWGMGCPVVRGEYLDADGVAVCIVLHVRDDQLAELEVFKEDNGKIFDKPRADRFEPVSMRIRE